jgi:hypothetical protein
LPSFPSPPPLTWVFSSPSLYSPLPWCYG